MTRQDIESVVLGALATVAPEIDTARLTHDAPLRGQVDLDSMDFLRFMIEVHRQSGVEIPEADYGRLASLDDVTEYVTAHAKSPATAERG